MRKNFHSNEQKWKFLCTVQNIQIEINFQLWNIWLACTLAVERPETSMEVCGLVHGAEKEKSLKIILNKITKGQTITHTSFLWNPQSNSCLSAWFSAHSLDISILAFITG